MVCLQYTSRAAQLYRQQLEKDAAKIKLDDALQSPSTPTAGATAATTPSVAFTSEAVPASNIEKGERQGDNMNAPAAPGSSAAPTDNGSAGAGELRLTTACTW